jgi:hemerythrin
MHQIEWKDDYLTGIEEIDRQHKDFVKLINRLGIVQEYGNKKAVAVRLLSELGKYAEYHFVSEENIMFLTKYPALERQQQAHAALLDEYSKRTQNFLNDKGTIEDVIRFLEGWFVRHTVEEDKKIGYHITATKI